MKKLLLAGTVSLLTLLSGCATVKPSGGGYTDQQPPQHESRIIVYRSGGVLLKLETPEVSVNGKSAGLLPDGTFVQVDTPPGIVSVQVQASPSKAWRFKPVGRVVNATPGRTVFLELDITSVSGGFITPIFGMVNSKVELQEVAPERARSALQQQQRMLPTDR